MTLYVLDTDTVVLFQEGNVAVCGRVLSRPIDELAVSVISVEEQLSGWYTMVRRAKDSAALARAYQRLADCVSLLSHFRILPFTESAIERYDKLAKSNSQNKNLASNTWISASRRLPSNTPQRS